MEISVDPIYVSWSLSRVTSLLPDYSVQGNGIAWLNDDNSNAKLRCVPAVEVCRTTVGRQNQIASLLTFLNAAWSDNKRRPIQPGGNQRHSLQAYLEMAEDIR